MTSLAVTLLLMFQLTGLTSHLPSGLITSLTTAAIPAVSKTDAHIAVAPSYTRAALPTLSDDNLGLGAKSVLAYDQATGAVLYEHNPSEQRPIASITKLMTILVILNRHDLSETVTVPTLPSYTSDAALVHFTPGQKLSLRDVLAAALIPSANDAADTLAIWDAGSVQAFTTRMNSLASQWGIGDVHFAGASGLTDDNNYATARSLAKIASLALTNSTVRGLVSTARTTITADNGQVYNLATTNDLLKDARFSGIKTGYTLAAGQCVVSLASVTGYQVITVVLGSPDRFGETTKLVNYLQGAIVWQ